MKASWKGRHLGASTCSGLTRLLRAALACGHGHRAVCQGEGVKRLRVIEQRQAIFDTACCATGGLQQLAGDVGAAGLTGQVVSLFLDPVFVLRRQCRQRLAHRLRIGHGGQGVHAEFHVRHRGGLHAFHLAGGHPGGVHAPAAAAGDDAVDGGAVADGELERVSILQVGDALIGVVGFLAAGVRARHEGPVALDVEAGLEHKPPVLHVVVSFECFAFVHEEHGHGACAGRDAAQVFAFADDADGGDDVQAGAARHRLRRDGAVTGHGDQWDHDRLLPLRPLPFPGGEVLFQNRHVVAPLNADAKLCGAGRHQHAQAHRRRGVAAPGGARFRRRLIVVARPAGLAVFEFALGVVLVALLARRQLSSHANAIRLPLTDGHLTDHNPPEFANSEGSWRFAVTESGKVASESKTPEDYFPRPTSGLRKAIGVGGAVIFGVHCISLSSSGFIPFSWVPSVWPGASIVLVLTIAMVMSLIHGYTFASIGAAMPRSGADYVLSSRLLHPIPAFMASWVLVVFSGVVAGGLVVWVPKSALPALLQPMAILFSDPRYSELATYSASPDGSLLIGTVLLVFTLALMMLPTRVILRIMSLGLVLGLLAWGIIYYSLWSASGPDAFKNAWNQFMATSGPFGSFDARIDLARRAGMEYSSSTLKMTLAGLLMGFWIYYGYYIPTFFAGEVRRANSSRALLVSSWSSILITWAIFTGAAVLLQRLVPLEWIAAEGYIANNGPAVKAVAGVDVAGYPWITFYAAILKPSWPLVLITAVAWIYTLINLVQTYFFYVSRIVFAWSFDRILPSFFSYVHPRTGSPVVCLLATAVLAEIGVVDASRSGPLGTQFTFAFFAVVTQLVAVTAIVLFPWRAPREFRLTPSFVRVRVLGLPIVSIVGSITFIYLLWMAIASFLFPAVGVASPRDTLRLLIMLALIGLGVFLGARWYRRRYSGMDISKIYRNAPPE